MPAEAFPPFNALLRRAHADACQSWGEIEPEFIATLTAFDAEYSRGHRASGWYQQKARYFNDLVILIIENCTGKTIAKRNKKKSVLFGKIDIDICYPVTGDPIVAAEVKALGTPPHPRNSDSARRASIDLHKRVREVAFTATDIKAAYAKPRPITSFKAWVDSAEPAYLSFWAVRVDGDADLSSVRDILASLYNYCNGVGAVIYGTRGTVTDYAVRHYSALSMERAIREFVQRVISRP